MLVDGMSLLFRGYYAMPSRRTSAGIPINAIYQWIRYFHDAFQAFQPTHVVCCWDMGSKTFRTKLYDLYKANRGEPPEDLIPQFELIKEVVQDSFEIPNVGVVGYEADDVIGTLSTKYSEVMDVLILTGDHDNLQLLNERVKVAIMKRGMGNYKVYCPDELNVEKGISPTQLIDVKAFMGDSSDNIPGVKGIGEVGALRLIKQYHDLQGVLENLDALTPAMRKKIEGDLEMLHLSKDLVTIRCDVPLEHQMEDSFWKLNREKMKNKFRELELGGLEDIF
ncbi:5'-3' exonuclease [Ammoniphilus oxalaticus]|uniref:5'-3' exonuclease n=1 Tax=Ammoniphilus oxalaticus TaxID=66863 RepID=A0A419SL70_9BACL|nr:5'-3' exonuclease H3TH domain-containing protein [Ammoniphilus oxalaticus]RKD24676.1 5'-3' exonuclease [Ammoniphilus oxalaticus]